MLWLPDPWGGGGCPEVPSLGRGPALWQDPTSHVAQCGRMGSFQSCSNNGPPFTDGCSRWTVLPNNRAVLERESPAWLDRWWKGGPPKGVSTSRRLPKKNDGFPLILGPVEMGGAESPWKVVWGPLALLFVNSGERILHLIFYLCELRSFLLSPRSERRAGLTCYHILQVLILKYFLLMPSHFFHYWVCLDSFYDLD